MCRSHGECMSPCMFVAPPWKMIEVSNAKASSSMLGSNVVAIIQNVPYRQNDCSLPCFWWGWPCIVRWLPADITRMEDWVFTRFPLLRKNRKTKRLESLHSGFVEHWNSQKSVSNIWQRFSCLLDEWIEKICKFFFFTMAFFLNPFYLFWDAHGQAG